MKRSSVFSLLVVVLLLLSVLGPVVWRAESVAAGRGAQLAAPDRDHVFGAAATGAILASQLMPARVEDASGDQLGEVVNLLADTTNGCVLYAVMASSAGIGLAGERAVPIPLYQLSSNPQQRTLILNTDASTVEAAPSFPLYSWPDIGRPGWDSQIRTYWARFAGTGEAAGESGCSGAMLQPLPAGAGMTTGTPPAMVTPGTVTALAGTPEAMPTVSGSFGTPMPTFGTSTPSGFGMATGTPVFPSGATFGTATPGGPTAVAPLGGTPTAIPSVVPVGETQGPLARASRLADYQVVTTDGQPLSRVVDLVIDRTSGQIQYVAVTVAGAALGTGTPNATGMPSIGTPATGSASVTPAASAGGATPTSTTLGEIAGATPTFGSLAAGTPTPALGGLAGATPTSALGSLTGATPPSTPGIPTGMAPTSAATALATEAVRARTVAAIPWDALRVDNGRQAFVLLAPASTLNNAPTFVPGQWPDMTRAGWDAENRRFWQAAGFGPGAVLPAGTRQPLATSSGTSMPAMGTPQPAGTATSATAGGVSAANAQPGGAGTGSGGAVVSVKRLLGYAVKDPNGQDLGRMSDMVASLTDGSILYGVAEFGGFLGLGARAAMVPWSAFQINEGQQAFMLSLPAETLQQAPEPDWNAIESGNTAWDQQVRSYWSSHGVDVPPVPPTGNATLAPSATPAPGVQTTGLARASQMLGSQVNTATGTGLGSVADLLASVSTISGPSAVATSGPGASQPTPGGTASPAAAGTGAASAPGTGGATSSQIIYVVVGTGGLLGLGQQTAPVPWSMFAVDVQKRAFTGNFDEQTLKAAPTIDLGKLPQSGTTGWDAQIRSYWTSRLGGSPGGGAAGQPSPTTTPVWQ